MIKVKFHANWRPDDYVYNWISKYTQDGKRWNDLELVSTDDYDFLVIMNFPKAGYNFDSKRTIFLQTEAAPIRQGWGEYQYLDHSKYYNVWKIPTVFGWSFNNSYSDLIDMEIKKTNVMSGVISNKQAFEGQKLRLKFAHDYLQKLNYYIHYGRGNGLNTDDKSDALFPYEYTFNAENTFEKDYFTEKIHDAIIAECLCFYDGCPNVGDYYDKDSFVKIDLKKPDEAIKIIKDYVDNDKRELHIDAIRKTKLKILNELQPMPLVERLIQEKQ